MGPSRRSGSGMNFIPIGGQGAQPAAEAETTATSQTPVKAPPRAPSVGRPPPAATTGKLDFPLPGGAPGQAGPTPPDAGDAGPPADEIDPAAIAAAFEIGGSFKRVLLTYRLYGEGHERRTEVENDLATSVRSFVERFGELALEIRSKEIRFRDKAILKEEKREESLINPVFVDGVDRVTFAIGVKAEELVTLFRTWHDAVSGRIPPEHSFSTVIWEQELATVSVEVKEGFAEDGSAENDSKQGRFDNLLSAFTDMPGLDTESRQPLVAIPSSSLSVLGQTGPLGEVRREDLARHDAAERAAVVDLHPTDRAAIVHELNETAHGIGERTLHALHASAAVSTPEELNEAIYLVKLILGTLLTERRLSELVRSLSQLSELAAKGDERARAFLGCLSDPGLIGAIVRLFGDVTTARAGVEILRHLPREHAGVLFPHLPALVKNEGRKALMVAILPLRPAPELLNRCLADNGLELAEDLLRLAELLGVEHVASLLKSMLASPVAEVRKAGVSHIRTDWLPHFRDALLPLASDPEPTIRASATALFMRARDPAIATALVAQLESDAPVEERKRSIVALGQIGGPAACAAIRKVFQHERDKDLRRAAALALGQVGDQGARAALEQEAHRVFADKEMKEACRAALKRLDLHARGKG